MPACRNQVTVQASFIPTTGRGLSEAALEYHIRGHWWTRVDYTYENIPGFYSGISKQYHTLNPRGITFGETYRFGSAGASF